MRTSQDAIAPDNVVLKKNSPEREGGRKLYRKEVGAFWGF